MKRLVRYSSYILGLVLVARRKAAEPELIAPKKPVPEPKPLAPPAAAGEPPATKPVSWFDYIRKTFTGFMDDDCMTLGASLAYYTVFSLPPLLLTIVSVAALVFGRQAVEHSLQSQIASLVGADAAEQVQSMLAHAWMNKSGGILGLVAGLAMLVFGATGAFVSLQDALNKAWHVKPDPKKGGVMAFLGKRVMSFGMIVVVGFLLLVSLAISAAISSFGAWIAPMLPGFLSGIGMQFLNNITSIGVIMLLFAAIFKYLPDAEIQWREVWMGAFLTSILFTVGKTAIGVYIGHSGTASAYGAAGSLVVVVLWLYYASLLVLLGAEFTKFWAAGHHRAIRPEPGAVAVVTEEKHVDRSGQVRDAA